MQKKNILITKYDQNVLLLTERHDRLLYNYRWKWADQIVGRTLWSTVLLVLVLVLIDGRCEIRLVGVVGRQVGGGVGAKVQSILLSQLVMVGEGRRHRRRCIVNHRAYGSRVDVATGRGDGRLVDVSVEPAGGSAGRLWWIWTLDDDRSAVRALFLRAQCAGQKMAAEEAPIQADNARAAVGCQQTVGAEATADARAAVRRLAVQLAFQNAHTATRHARLFFHARPAELWVILTVSTMTARFGRAAATDAAPLRSTNAHLLTSPHLCFCRLFNAVVSVVTFNLPCCSAVTAAFDDGANFSLLHNTNIPLPCIFNIVCFINIVLGNKISNTSCDPSG
ncbi:hypothetical protein T09_10256 [Trichinella sp. T9]|nr:hypothetical protein T09_10256 [Trichinella sp. T9]